ncbi:Outer membrane protein assembly factor BamD [Rhodobacteraceae bacterium THAF1]|uniref:peptidoglycan-binding protein n=1 Tax=Palleronia sp. THAF1 TaxID=2587842 RepID=UPI000F3E96E5|nr:peptidoglycan-binding protein [Palleronia sp. THAF1]QFU09851.1 Outer membrane protein assembly factor BamD [Palleronia sp. THAF1]VDC17246.1 Outer membrane protein assembly factor BamD [Rhodobacteraceae bacterium THAF1]
MRRLIALLCLLATPSFAEEAALVIANARYDTLDRTRQELRGYARAVDALEDAGVATVTARDADRATIFARLRAFSQMGRSADAVAVVLTGRFGIIEDTAWFLPVEAEGNGAIDSAEAGVPVLALTDLMADAAGRSVLVLGAADPDAIPDLDLPSGVTLVVTDPVRALRFTRDVLAEPGASIEADSGLRVDGFAPRDLTFLLPGRETAPSETTEEERYWALTQQRDDATAYRAYLQRYPDGAFALPAQLRLDALTETPEQRAERAETALGLSRPQRQDVQRDLSVLGYDTRGIDGIFGPGTRGALRSWQSRNDFEQTGFLTSRQVQLLDAQGSARAAELEAEERRRREELRRQDEQLWSSMGSERSEAELATYLDRFPDGIYAGQARERLAEIRDRRAEDEGASERERQIWRATRAQNTVQGYQTYINAFPDGQFVAEARAAIIELRGADSRNAEAEAAEAAVGLNSISRRAIETRLARLNLNPGSVDGTFDDATRAALRRYQQGAGLPATGYVNQITAVRLLADTLRDVLR